MHTFYPCGATSAEHKTRCWSPELSGSESASPTFDFLTVSALISGDVMPCLGCQPAWAASIMDSSTIRAVSPSVAPASSSLRRERHP